MAKKDSEAKTHPRFAEVIRPEATPPERGSAPTSTPPREPEKVQCPACGNVHLFTGFYAS